MGTLSVNFATTRMLASMFSWILFPNLFSIPTEMTNARVNNTLTHGEVLD